MIFALASAEEANLALIAIVATVITALFKLLADNTKAQSKMVEATQQVATETAKGNREAKQRNGHLGQQNVQITELITGQNRDIGSIKTTTEQNLAANLEAVAILRKTAVIAAEDRSVLTSPNQNVENQTVEHQVIKGRK